MLEVAKNGNKNIFLLLNQENFEESLKSHNFTEVFEDTFGVNFGHSTTYGNSLISNNVFQFIKKLKNEGRCGL